ncbi:hypothetical protein [Prosthecobacter vanneervenii]|uniref:Glycine zipper domain-containing protein n=1 Tax=Prosthecobacter vanneervenii TaxID=48466 RepID=A0A7W8DJS7_9BACT|nr:hypothetical protein [Prosthecobacter vanneervenii]MBB5032387.1 hypothetical protein [Prosthecobacter vanneervenii]
MKTSILILLAGLCSVLPACSNSSGGVNKGLVGAGAGGLLGALVGDHLLKSNNSSSSTTTGGGGGTTTSSSSSGGLSSHAGLISGAVAGYAAGAISDSMAQNEVRQKYLDGYNKGRSDAIKDLYWLKRDAERPSGDGGIQRRYYEVPVPEHVTTDGVLVEPRKVVIEVVE